MNVSRIFSSVGRVFGKSSKKVVAEVAPKAVPVRKTLTLTDPITGKITGLERQITRNGQEATARIDYLEDGSRKLTITGGGNDLWRTTTVKREKGAGIFGGDRITVDKDSTLYWCHGERTKLIKEYNPQGVLQHKDLHYSKNIGNETFITHNATQDRVYGEYPLDHSVESMLKNPSETKGIQHSLDGRDNYGNFSTRGTNYERAVKAKEQAAIDAAKKAEAEQIAAKEAAEKAAAELRAKQPRINIGKALNKDINSLTVKETKLANGAVQRTFTDPDTGKVLAKTEDLGILHKEWIYGGKADMIYMKQVGKDNPYILAKKGNYTQVSYAKKENNGYGIVDNYYNYQYYNDGASHLRRYSGGGNASGASGSVQIFDSTAAERRKRFPGIAKDIPDYPKMPIHQDYVVHDPYQNRLTHAQEVANSRIRELNQDAQNNVLNLEDLFSDYKA